MTREETIQVLCGAHVEGWKDCPRCDHRYRTTTYWGPLHRYLWFRPGTYGKCSCPKRLLPAPHTEAANG